eukprot:2524771-Pleurochrysis_carterae.AAC.1
MGAVLAGFGLEFVAERFVVVVTVVKVVVMAAMVVMMPNSTGSRIWRSRSRVRGAWGEGRDE